MKFVGILLLFFVFKHQAECKLARDEGYGNTHTLATVQDTFVERFGRAWDRPSFGTLIVGHVGGFDVKRILIQFENLPSSCPVNKIVWARFFMHFVTSPRVSGRPVAQQPWIDYTFNVHRIKRFWDEATTTPRYRCRSCSNRNWYQPRLELGRDAVPEPECKKTVIRSSEPRGRLIEFDITGAMKAWASGESNYGVLVKVVREHINARDLRFWDRHQDEKLRPFAQVLCRY